MMIKSGRLLIAKMKFCSIFRFSNQFDPAHIRNFCIIAHIDHGKSTLADRLLELTNTIQKGGNSQYLDKLSVERERGITIKAQSASMFYTKNDENVCLFVLNDQYLFNLIDTPGHVDFTYEVSRSMRACQGALLLVDATQGVQAQTFSNFKMAKLQKLAIIPVINKVDVQTAHVEQVANQLTEHFGFNESDILYVSAKTGKNVEKILESIIHRIPPPNLNMKDPVFKGFLVDSWFLKDKGVVTLMQIKSGKVKKGDTIVSCAFSQRYDVFEVAVFKVGILNPEFTSQKQLYAGQVGYLMTNMKKANEARIGDTFKLINTQVVAEEGFEPAKPLVYCGIYPIEPETYSSLTTSLSKLSLTDPAVTIVKESSAALGNGFRCGFLGLLHMDVFRQRLEDEYSQNVLLTTPNVPYRVKLREGKVIEIENAALAPEGSSILYYEEPIARATIMCPKEYIKNIIRLCQDRRGTLLESKLVDDNEMMLYELPLQEIIIDFFDKLKSLTKGFGTLEYEFVGYRQADIKKMVIHLMDDPIDTLSFMVHADNAQILGKQICVKLKDSLPQQLFVINIQAKIGGRVIASEKVQYMRKNVTAKCYGGDFSRKKKLLDRQKEGKKRMRMLGRVEVHKDTLINILKS